MVKIGIIDSGIGGLSVLRHAIDMRAEAEYIYLYDSKYHPYGGRSREELTAITFRNIETLIAMGAELIVLACNTATSACAENMRATFSLPIIGTEPPVKPASAECDRIAVLATRYTLQGSKLKGLTEKYPDKTFLYPDCGSLATAIEYSLANESYLDGIVRRIMTGCEDAEGVVIGCTHYYYIINILNRLYPHIKVFEPCSGVAKRIKSFCGEGVDSDIKILPTGEKPNEHAIRRFLYE